MDRATALAVWKLLEEARETEYEGDPASYDVRLDATTGIGISGLDERGYRVRVTPGRGIGGWSRDALLYVLEVAGEQSEKVEFLDVANSGIELY